MMNNEVDYSRDSIRGLLFRLAPPVMLASFIQALYNIVDSIFIGRYSPGGLTALSIIFPVQLLMLAFSVGTGVGINTAISYYMGVNKSEKVKEIVGMGTVLAIIWWLIFVFIGIFILPCYAHISTDSLDIIEDTIFYGRTITICSAGLFAGAIWTKIYQSHGNMTKPMCAQIIGALVNIILDPILIFGLFDFPELQITGAAIATIIGQLITATILFKVDFIKIPPLYTFINYICFIYYFGIPNILMQSAYTFYILGLNLILSRFSDAAVTTLGLYYKWQSIFFIPLDGLETCVVPIISYNYACRNFSRCQETLKQSVYLGCIFIMLAFFGFEFFPDFLLRIFTIDREVISIGVFAFRIIGLSFLPIVTSIIFPIYFQARGNAITSSLLTIVRTVVLFVPLGYFLAKIGLNTFWFTFPITEILTSIVGFFFYCRSKKEDYERK